MTATSHEPLARSVTHDAHGGAGGASVEVLVPVLANALRALADKGRSDAEVASRLAAQAYAALRHDHPKQAQKINALMHRLTRLAGPPTTIKETDPMSTDLDVRSEPPARRHQLIFSTYEGLAAGDDFVLINDHDPLPLRYQFDAEHAGEFTWDYLEQGPATWRVRIGRPAKSVA